MLRGIITRASSGLSPSIPKDKLPGLRLYSITQPDGLMKSERVYLKQNVMVEPLFNQWYAWTHLISPATAAIYMANSHLKIMQSFISAPKIHASALKNPAMIGGPFID